MLSAFTMLVWVPTIVATPTIRIPSTAFVISWALLASFRGCIEHRRREAPADPERRASEVGADPQQPAVHVGVHQESTPVIVDRQIAVARHRTPVSGQISADDTDGLP
jgi:hypothetical protein